MAEDAEVKLQRPFARGLIHIFVGNLQKLITINNLQHQILHRNLFGQVLTTKVKVVKEQKAKK